jgi:hypothetical protein
MQPGRRGLLLRRYHEHPASVQAWYSSVASRVQQRMPELHDGHLRAFLRPLGMSQLPTGNLRLCPGRDDLHFVSGRNLFCCRWCNLAGNMPFVQRWHQLPPGLGEQHSAMREGLLLPRRYCANAVQFGHVLIRNKSNEFKHLHPLPGWIVVRLGLDSADAVPGGHVVQHAQRAGCEHVRVLSCRQLHARRRREGVHQVPPGDVLWRMRNDAQPVWPGHLQLLLWRPQSGRVPAVQRRYGVTLLWRCNERNMHSRAARQIQWRGRKRVYPVPGGLLLCNRRLVRL